MTLAHLAQRMARYAAEAGDRRTEPRRRDLVPGLSVFRETERTRFEASVYDPIVCLILQGEKETVFGRDRRILTRAGEALVVSHDLPVVARITRASPSRPYLSLIAHLDLAELRSLHGEVGEPPEEPADAYAVGPLGRRLLDVMTRYVDLVDDPEGARVLAPLVRRELHYRLLTAPQGAMLRRLLHRDSHASKIARALRELRSAYRERLEIPALARSVGMSTSSFHRHFKQVTATTPLQYQKDIRLAEAQRLLRGGEHSVSTAAFAVGYESATQFSREYARKFGVPPREHLRRPAADPGPPTP